jgi:N-methylhydantoinase B/oxoprolinase/acetone carboxylase alpha subunit
MLRSFSAERGLPEVGTVVAEDCMDDGTPIRLAVTIDRRDGSAVFDFKGGDRVQNTHCVEIVNCEVQPGPDNSVAFTGAFSYASIGN